MPCGAHPESMASEGGRPREVRVSRWTVESLLVTGPLLAAAIASTLALSWVLVTEPESPPWAVVATSGILVAIGALLVLDLLRLRHGVRGPRSPS